MTPSTPSRIAIDIGIIVANMAQSLRFYSDLLGLPTIAEATTSLIGKGHMVQLQHGDSLIKLIQLDEEPGAANPTGINASHGYRYITLLVSNINTMMEKIERNEVPVALPMTQLGNGATIAMVQDPDGNTVEFVQER